MNRKLNAVMLVAALFAAGAAHAKTIKMEVNGLVCAFCAQGIEKKLRSMGATDVYVSLESKLVAATLKDGQDISDAQLRSSLKDSGYDVQKIERVDASLEALGRKKAAK